jgi:putative transposase
MAAFRRNDCDGCCQKREYMNSHSYPRIKNTTVDDLGLNYNHQHLVFTTKYRHKVFNDAETIRVAREALYLEAIDNGMEIKVLSFGDDYAHIHIEVNVPNTMTIAEAARLLKGYSAHELLRKIPRLRTDFFWGGHFWGKHYSNGSVGPQGEEVIQNYIKRQDISGQFQ